MIRQFRETHDELVRRFVAYSKDLERRSQAGEFGKWPWQEDYGLWPWQRRKQQRR